VTLPLAPGQRPRAWQLAATDAARAAFRQGLQAVIVSAATGTGKGTLLAAWARLAAARGPVLVLVHREELVIDLYERIKAIPGGHSVGVVWAARNEILADIVVASVQSLRGRLAQLRGPHLVITDECHHAPAPTYRAIYERVAELVPKWKHLGMTATPFRSAEGGSTTGLGDVFQAVVYEHGIGDAIAAGDLVPVRGIRVETQLDISECRVGKSGDYVEDDLARLVDVEARNSLIVDYYEREGGNRPALVFAASVEHAQHLAETFQRRGHDFQAVWGDMPRADRKRIVGDYLAGRTLGLVSRDLLFEGFDAPRASILLKARPTKSRVIFVQMVGRGLRLFLGKSEALLLDFVDNGCDLDLSSIADLSPTAAAADKAARTFVEGDLVEHRTQPLGQGIVEAVVEGPLYWVMWYESGDRALHGPGDLMRPRAARPEDDVDRDGLRIARVADYEVLLLPGSKVRDAAGWYHYSDVWTVGARGEDGAQATGLVRQTGPDWSAWLVRRGDAEQLGRAPTREAACLTTETALRARGLRFGRVDAEWKAQAATERQIAALRAWRIRRDLDTISKGEASALLDAVAARRTVAAAIRDLSARRAAE